MRIINLCQQNSLVSQYMCELRDKVLQQDRMRFRRNVQRLGQILAYEMSKYFDFEATDTITPLGVARTHTISDQVVLATILRAGLPFHEGFLSYLDNAENAFVSAYRKYEPGSDTFDIHIEYMACPPIEGKTLVIADPMLATGSSMELAYRALLSKGTPKHVHVACVIASDQAIEFVKQHFPDDNTTVWACDIDHKLNSHSYIIPGLGDAGDLLYGQKSDWEKKLESLPQHTL
ncbi:MAG: uracil phosphoribosyltransferase [Muribaculaceae bacterium]|nr:uracil phosphoribosyltransferase [Muribaculaceae bacterium]